MTSPPSSPSTGRLWISHTEPSALITDLQSLLASHPTLSPYTFTSSTFPEDFGVDVLWTAPPPSVSSVARSGLIGVQRKTVPDLVASLHDGRLQREFALMSPLHRVVLLVEGPERWSPDGDWTDGRMSWSLTSHRSLLRVVQSTGVWVMTSPSLAHTPAVVLEEILHDTRHHRSLSRRPDRPPTTDSWGNAHSTAKVRRAFAVHLLQSFPSIGPAVAEAIVDHFDGRPPLAWNVTPEDLLAVPGVGKRTVERLLDHLPALAALSSLTEQSDQ